MAQFGNFRFEDKNIREINKETKEEILSLGDESENEKPKEINELISLENFNDEDKQNVYEWYGNAISRRDREPLEKDRFYRHFFDGGSTEKSFAFGNNEKGYLLGLSKYGVFVPTHFAPKTLRGGYDLFKDLGDNQKVPAVMSITQDLAETIKKMPSWHELDMNFLSFFRDKIEDKVVFYNSNPNVQNLMTGLVDEYLNETNYHSNLDFYEDNDYQEQENIDKEDNY